MNRGHAMKEPLNAGDLCTRVVAITYPSMEAAISKASLIRRSRLAVSTSSRILSVRASIFLLQ